MFQFILIIFLIFSYYPNEYEIYLAAVGFIFFIVVIIFAIISITCWKGRFIRSFLEKPVLKYMMILYGSSFCAINFYSGIKFFIEAKRNFNNEGILYTIMSISSLALTVFQMLSFASFIVGLCFVYYNKSDKEILANHNLREYSPLIENK